ncbi:MAG: insulinase family protein [Ignavibacteriales bacterium]|nr:MAG: insulinase family protein [Ignavibacteriales bacterium]
MSSKVASFLKINIQLISAIPKIFCFLPATIYPAQSSFFVSEILSYKLNFHKSGMDIKNLKSNSVKLNNGLELILYKDSTMPLVALHLLYKVGSANEVNGKSGLAHLFEHMMFQGSQNIPKGMQFKLVQEAGGIMNGATSFDRTVYYYKLPSNQIELALWMESDRMGFLLPTLDEAKLKNQIDVVSNERLERYDNQPYGLAWEIIHSNLFPEDHPYHSVVIGSLNDISNSTLTDILQFAQQYYCPSNASLVVAGDYPENIVELVEKYFGEINSNGKNSLPKFIADWKVTGNKITRYEDVQLNRIYLAWKTDKIFSKFDARLDILGEILTGSKSSRLQKKLIYENELVQDITANQFSGKYDGYFYIIATLKPGIDAERVKEIVISELNSISKNGITETELQKCKNVTRSGFIYSIQNIDSLAAQFNSYNFYLGSPNNFEYELNEIESIQPDEIKSAVDKYFFNPFVELQIVRNKKATQ